jgi:hypothetical protein
MLSEVTYYRDESYQIRIAIIFGVATILPLIVLFYLGDGFFIVKIILAVVLAYLLSVILISSISQHIAYITLDKNDLIFRLGPIGFRKEIKISLEYIEKVSLSKRIITRPMRSQFGTFKGADYKDPVEALLLELNHEGVETVGKSLTNLCQDRLPDFGITRTDSSSFLITDKPKNGFYDLINTVNGYLNERI